MMIKDGKSIPTDSVASHCSSNDARLDYLDICSLHLSYSTH